MFLKINTGAKYNDDVFQFSVGLNGVGTKAVNALSAYFLVRSHRDGEFVEAEFESGELTRERKEKQRKRTRHSFHFLWSTIFKKFKFNTDHLARQPLLRLLECKTKFGLMVNYSIAKEACLI